MTDDVELLRRYAEEKSEAAFAELVHRHLDLVYSAAWRRLGGDAHGAVDVAQRVFTALARQAATLARHTQLPGWLYTTTRNVAVAHLRGEARRQRHEQEAHAMQELNSGPAAEWERLRPLLDGAMDELGGRDREAVLLRFFARQPFAEIGRALNLSEDAARMRVERALEKLRLLLARRGVTSTLAALTLVLANQASAAAPAGLAGAVTGTALASVAAAPAVGVFSFMSTSKLAVGGAAFVLALGIGGAGYQYRLVREDEAARAALRTENAALAAKVAAARGRADSAEQAAAARREALAAQKAAKQRADREAAQAAAAVALEKGEAFMARHPEVREASLESRRMTQLEIYAPLLKELRLSPAQIERFKTLAASGRAVLSTPDGQLMEYMAGSDRRVAEAELRELLGEAGYQRYKDWNGGAGEGRVDVDAAV